MENIELELDVKIQPKIKKFFEESGGINIWQSHDLSDPSKRVFTKLTETTRPSWQFIDYVPLTDYSKIKWYTWITLARFKKPKHQPPQSIWQQPSDAYLNWIESICKKNNINYATAVVDGAWVYDGFYDDPKFPGFNGCDKVFEVAYKKYLEG